MERRTFLKMVVSSLATTALTPTLPAIAKQNTPELGCGAEFPFFGASYNDARCIEGFLWDLDAYDDGYLTSGGEDPCPHCNAKAFLEWVRDEIEENGWIAFTDGDGPRSNPYLRGSRFPHLTSQFQTMWDEGFKAASVDPVAIADRLATPHPERTE